VRPTEVGTDTPLDVPTFDAGTDADAAPDSDDTDLRPDIDAEDDAPDAALLGAGDPCETDDECESDFCVTIDVGDSLAICSERCVDEGDCADGSECVRLGGGGADVELVCLAGDFCLDPDGDAHGLGPGCDGDDCDESDPGRYVNAVETCDGIDNDCDEEIDNEISVVGDLCESGFPGACAEGLYDCDSGLLECRPRTVASVEICNGADDDCDGETDEDEAGEPLARDCYAGPAETQDVGLCMAGQEVCVEADYTSCTGQVVPTAELCNGDDDDCDGLADEGEPEAGGACATGGLGVCSPGVRECTAGAVRCAPLTVASEEICDFLDNDCDGSTDESGAGGSIEQICYTGLAETRAVGECVDGIEVCQAGEFRSCNDQQLPVDEVCNGLDDDCDGEVDEGNPGGDGSCPTGVPGLCSVGVRECVDGGLVCTQTVFPTAEVCDGEDNDCDTRRDEDPSNSTLARDCYTGPDGTLGVGTCSGGTQICDLGAWAACSDEVLPSLDTCDGRNNDCDADGADEENPGAGLVCSSGEFGICSAGTTTCSGGAINCVPNLTARPETCDGNDQDCDGAVDEDSEGNPLAQECYTGPVWSAGVGVCRGGERVCSDGAYGIDCLGELTPTTEICNGTDEDCDATVDDGCPIGLRLVGGNTSGQYGGGGGSSFSDACTSSQVIVGINVRAGSRVDRIQAVCGTISMSTNTSTTPYSYSVSTGVGSTLGTHGGSGGTAYSYLCPANQMVSGIVGRQASAMDAIGINCSPLIATGIPGSYSINRGAGSSSSQYGGSGGSAFSYTCPGNDVVRGIFGRSASRVDALGVYCGDVSATLR
jgi:hypothetical protein